MAVTVKLHGVAVGRPVCGQGDVACWHGKGDTAIFVLGEFQISRFCRPCGKGGTGLRRSNDRDGFAVVVAGVIRAVSGVDGDSVFVDIPLCVKSKVFGDRRIEVELVRAILVSIPIDEGVAFFGGVGRSCNRSVILDICADNIKAVSVAIKGDGAGVGGPPGGQSNVVCRHGEFIFAFTVQQRLDAGRLDDPLDKGRTFFLRSVYENGRTVVVRSADGVIVANINGHDILVGRPLCVKGDVVGDVGAEVKFGSGAGLILVPAAKDITILLGGSRLYNGLVVLDGSCLVSGLAVGFEGHSVGFDRPLCIENGVRSDCSLKVKFFGAVLIGIPAAEGITIGHRISDLYHRCAIRNIYRGIGSMTVAIEGNGVLVERPLCVKRNIGGDGRFEVEFHGAGFVFVPSAEGVVIHLGVIRFLYSGVVLNIHRKVCAVSIAVEGDGVAVGRPLGGQGDIFCRHGELILAVGVQRNIQGGGGNFPACKGRTGLLRGVHGHDGTIRILVLSRVPVAGIHSYGVLVDCPLCIKGGVSSNKSVKIERVCAGFIGVPAAEGVTGLLKGSRLCNFAVVGDCYGQTGIVAVAVEGDGVAVGRPVCGQGDVPCRHGKGDAAVFVLGEIQTCRVRCPVEERGTGLCRNKDRDGFAVFITGVIRAVAGVDGDSVFVDSPLCVKSDVFGNRGIKAELVFAVFVSIPIDEGITFCSGGWLCNFIAACDIRLGDIEVMTLAIKCYSVSIGLPVCGQSYFACRNLEFILTRCVQRRNDGVRCYGPAVEGVALSLRNVLGNDCFVLIRSCDRDTAIVQVNSDRIFVLRPLCVKGEAFCDIGAKIERVSCENGVGIPAAKVVAGLFWVSRLVLNGFPVVDGAYMIGRSVIVKGYGIFVRSPFCVKGDIFCDFRIKREFVPVGASLVFVPAAKGISGLAGLSRLINGGVILDFFDFRSGVVICIKGYFILVDFPLCVQSDIVGDGSVFKIKHVAIDVAIGCIPVNKGITVVFGGSGLLNLCIMGNSRSSIRAVAV